MQKGGSSSDYDSYLEAKVNLSFYRSILFPFFLEDIFFIDNLKYIDVATDLTCIYFHFVSKDIFDAMHFT